MDRRLFRVRRISWKSLEELVTDTQCTYFKSIDTTDIRNRITVTDCKYVLSFLRNFEFNLKSITY